MDRALLLWLNRPGSPWLDGVMLGVSNRLLLLTLAICAVLLILSRARSSSSETQPARSAKGYRPMRAKPSLPRRATFSIGHGARPSSGCWTLATGCAESWIAWVHPLAR